MMDSVLIRNKRKWLKLMLIFLLLVGVFLGVKLVQQSQENRSKAASDDRCISVGGECQVFSNPQNGADCNVGGWAGYIKSGLCSGNSNRRCCVKYSDAGCRSLGGQCQRVASKSVKECTINGQSGTIVTNKCGGSSTIRCCAPAGTSGVESSTNPISDAPTATPVVSSGGGGGGGAENRLVVASFNVGHANKTSKASYSSIGTEIKENGFDIIGMQEANSTDTLSKRIAAIAEMNYYAHVPTSAGNSILSRKDLADSTYIQLTRCGRDSMRALQKTILTVNNKKISFYNVHVDPASSCRRTQVKDVIKEINKDSNPWILVGDFNFGLSGCNEAENLFDDYTIASYDEVNNGTRCTDMVIFSKNRGIGVVSKKSYKTRGVISDHNLVSVTFEIN